MIDFSRLVVTGVSRALITGGTFQIMDMEKCKANLSDRFYITSAGLLMPCESAAEPHGVKLPPLVQGLCFFA